MAKLDNTPPASRAPEILDFFRRAVPEPFRILGLQLKPLSLGRYRLLKRFECAFVSDDLVPAGIGDLIIGVLICSQRADEFVTWANSPDFSRDIAKWSERLCPRPRLGWLPIYGPWRRRRPQHSFNVVEKLQLFQRYIEDSSQIPKFWCESSGESSGQPWAQACETALRSELGWSEEEINERPITKAIGDFFALAESRGQIKLMTKEDLEQIAEMERAAKLQTADRLEACPTENGS